MEQGGKIHVALVLQNALFRSSLSELIRHEKGIGVVYEGDGRDFCIEGRTLAPPIVVVVEAQRLDVIKKSPFRSSPILVLSIQDDLHDFRLAVQHGAKGYLPQVDAGAEAIPAIRALAWGRNYLGKALMANMPNCLLPELTQELFLCNEQRSPECEKVE